MLEIEQLEKDYRRYRLKKIRPYAIASIVLVLAVAAISFSNKIKSSISLEEKNEIIAQKNGISHKIDLDTDINISRKSDEIALDEKKASIPKSIKIDDNVTIPDAKIAKESILLSPDTSFLATFTANSSNKTNSINDNEVIAGSKKEIKNKQEAYIDKSNNNPSSNLIVSTKKSNNTLAHLIKKYNEQKDAKLASYISSSYYKKGNYKDALKWSIEANSLDPSSEESWILFAKANVKLGRKDVAISALKTYLNQYSSKNVKTLLKSLESSR